MPKAPRPPGCWVLRPLLGVWVDAKDLIVESDLEQVRLHGVSAETASALLARIGGRRRISDLFATADQDGEEGIRELALLDALVRAELIVVSAPSVGVSGTEAAERFSAAFTVWNQRLFSHPLWLSLVEGTASRALIIGWVLETYHFIRGACARLPLAVAHCPAGPQRDVLSGHFSEEYNHDELFLTSLRALDVDEEVVRTTPPLPGTLAVIDAMREAARRDVVAYSVCSGLLESTGSDAARGRQFYNLLEAHYGALGDFVEPMRRHVDLDEGFGHGSVMAEVFAAEGMVDRRRLDQAAATVYGFVETLETWFTDILEHYEPLTNLQLDAARRYRPTQVECGSAAYAPIREAETKSPLPLLSPAVEIRSEEGIIRIEDPSDVLTYTDSSAALIRQAVPYLNGSASVPAIADTIGVSPECLSAHVAPLFDTGFALDAAKAFRTEEPEEFADALNVEASFWNRAFFAQPFPRRLLEGSASPTEVMCWGVEFTHFIRGANQYMAAGVAHCDPASPWLTPLAEHFAEEWAHAGLFLDGLTACGFDRSAIETSQPLAETQALLNRFAEIGRHSTIGYASLFAFMRPLSNGQPKGEDLALMGRLSECYPYASGLFRAIAEHGRLDRELGHGAAPIFGLLRQTAGLSQRDRWEAVAAVRTAAESFTALAAAIERRCAHRSVYYLRPPACFESLPGAS